jgi:hypothetical protein
MTTETTLIKNALIEFYLKIKLRKQDKVFKKIKLIR